jgi:1,4-dihydroxy-2-naphthoate polyprenyltransferase
LKYIGLGEIAVLLVLGPLMVGGGYFAVTGRWSGNAILASLPCALGATTVIFGKHIDKLKADAAKGIRTLPVLLGERNSRVGVMILVALQYLLAGLLVATGYFSWVTLVVMFGLYFSLPIWRMFPHPRPETPPQEAKPFWPMWFVASAFYHYRAYGILFLAGLILQLAIR